MSDSQVNESTARLMRERDEARAEADHWHLEVASEEAEWRRLGTQLDQARALIAELLEEVGPCDEDNPHVEVWCIRHQSKRCRVPELRERFQTLLTPNPTEGTE